MHNNLTHVCETFEEKKKRLMKHVERKHDRKK